MSSNGRLRPLCIQVHARDNVAIVANEGGLLAGALLDNGLILIDAIPEAHKVALCGIAAGEPGGERQTAQFGRDGAGLAAFRRCGPLCRRTEVCLWCDLF